MAAIVAEHLQKKYAREGSVALASIYCNYKDNMDQTPVNLLANIWTQIRRQGPLDPAVESLYDRNSNARPRLDDVCKILRAEINRLDKAFVIVDALDECQPAYRLRLLTELRALQPKLRLMVTSRFFDSFGADMGLDTDIEILAHDADIKRYVEEIALMTPRLARWMASEASLVSTIVEKVTEAAQRM